MRKSKVNQVLEPTPQIFVGILLIFAVITGFFGQHYLAAAEVVVAVVGFVILRRAQLRRRRAVAKLMDSMAGNMDVAAKDTMVNSPLPMVIFRPETDEIIWTNDRFLHLTGGQDHLFDTKLGGVVEGFSTRWLMEGKNVCPQEVKMGDRRFQVFGHLVRTDDPTRSSGFLATTYWVDITELSLARDAYAATRPVVALLVIDNYDEVLKSASDTARSEIVSAVNQKLTAWTDPSGGVMCRMDRDRYLFVFEERCMQGYIDSKFSILDAVRAIQTPDGNQVTLSVGIGRGGENFKELYSFASLSIEMALSRGGDQAVIRNKVGFEFYGGHAKELERRTKVKSRVMANALAALISDASGVFVMGHKYPDLDALGAAAGVCALARKLRVPAYLIREPGSYPGKVMAEKLMAADYYSTRFLTQQDALVMADSRALLVVVDTNRPDQVQAEELLESCTKVAVIDHHRRAAEYIEGAALNFHEPFASSASELVSELLQYQVDSADLLKVEAEALMAGIMLDTKNFTLRTGGRTFEAAAYLRRAGADTSEVRKLFQNDLSGAIARYDIIRDASIYRDGIAVAVVEHAVGRIPAAQAADELLNISGIDASFVVYIGEDGTTMISGRSMGSVNVQVILETLGGGGNGASAGAQLPSQTVHEAAVSLRTAIDKYLERDS